MGDEWRKVAATMLANNHDKNIEDMLKKSIDLRNRVKTDSSRVLKKD